MERMTVSLKSGITLSALFDGSHFMFAENARRFDARVGAFLSA